MSSTIDVRDQRGQVLPLFALMATALVLVAALAFDTGMVLLEKRDQQNAADAAALAGARFLPGNTGMASARAHTIAADNGFAHGVGSVTVSVTFPQSGFIRVTIANARQPLFAGIAGISSWDVGATALAANVTNAPGNFALLALHPDACPAFVVEGNGTVESAGNIQVNSTCTTGEKAFRVAGKGSLKLTAAGVGCNVVGGASSGGGVAHNDCNPANEGATSLADPFGGRMPPDKPPPAAAIEIVAGGGTIPDACPGGTAPATDLAPALCSFGGSYDATKTWRIYPGYYPGGLNLQGGNFLMEPGIYYMGGGGFRAANVGLTSVDAGTQTVGGGILIYNTTHPSFTAGKVVLQGGEATVSLRPLNQNDPWDNFVIFQDRSLGPSPDYDVEIVGGSSTMDVRGMIYAPGAQVVVEGNGGTVTVDQAIASKFRIKGNSGTIKVLYDQSYVPTYSGAGLVE